MNLFGFEVRWYHAVIAAVIVFVAGFLWVGGLGCPPVDPMFCTESMRIGTRYLLLLMFLFGVVSILISVFYLAYRYLNRSLENSKIADLGVELGVKKGDIRRMKITRAGLMIVKAVLAFFISLLYLLFFLLGLDIKTAVCPHVLGYPYMRSMGLLPALPTDRKKSRIAVLLLSAITLLIMINSSPVFGQQCVVPLYGVFSRKKRR